MSFGGYLTLDFGESNEFYHESAARVNSARFGLELILKKNSFKKIYVPFFICDVVLQPIKSAGIEVEFYRISNEFFPVNVKLCENEVLLFVNYFGILDHQIKTVLASFDNVILDLSQSFYSKFSKDQMCFYSARKFFGCPDGGLVYPNYSVDDLQISKSFDRMKHLIQRLDDENDLSYQYYIKNESLFDKDFLQKMSKLTTKILNCQNYKEVQKIRMNNFTNYHRYLKEMNELTYIIDVENMACPLTYPFLKKGNFSVKDKMIEQEIFLPTYWKNTIKPLGEDWFENHLRNNTLHLPLDQRISQKDVEHIINVLFKLSD